MTFGVILGLIAFAFAGTRAEAAHLYGYWLSTHEAGHGHRKQAAPPSLAASIRTPVPKQPLQIVISIADQTISVYSGDALIARSVVSTGVPEHPTPMGVFTVIQKQRWHRSNLYSDAPMPYMQRITWSGVALHAGVLPGHPASHGCIRLKEDFAVELWRLTKLGNRVIIAPRDVVPVEVAQPRLFQRALVAETSSSPSTPAEPAKSADAPADPAAKFIEPVKAVGVGGDAGDPPAARQTTAGNAPGQSEGATPPPKPEPISVLISRKQGKLLVRQGFTPLLESEVTIRDPERPLGTHVFTAFERNDDAGAMRWTVVSFPDDSPRKIDRGHAEAKPLGRGDRSARHAKPLPRPRPSAARATAALDRIEIPHDTADRIAALLIPKSSLIVSDQPLSEETDSDTDFIVLVR